MVTYCLRWCAMNRNAIWLHSVQYDCELWFSRYSGVKILMVCQIQNILSEVCVKSLSSSMGSFSTARFYWVGGKRFWKYFSPEWPVGSLKSSDLESAKFKFSKKYQFDIFGPAEKIFIFFLFIFHLHFSIFKKPNQVFC